MPRGHLEPWVLTFFYTFYQLVGPVEAGGWGVLLPDWLVDLFDRDHGNKGEAPETGPTLS